MRRIAKPSRFDIERRHMNEGGKKRTIRQGWLSQLVLRANLRSRRFSISGRIGRGSIVTLVIIWSCGSSRSRFPMPVETAPYFVQYKGAVSLARIHARWLDTAAFSGKVPDSGLINECILLATTEYTMDRKSAPSG